MRVMRIPPLFAHSTITLGAALLLGAGFLSADGRQAPAQAPPAAKDVQAGEPLFAAYCGFCHGRDATGGTTGPDLTRSAFVSEDVNGDRIKPLIRTGRPERGMPPISISDAEATSIVAFVHDRRIKEGSLVGARRRVSEDDLNTGDAKAGEAYFNGAGRCATCHSSTGDLAGVATRLQGLELLQRMLYPSKSKVATVTVTTRSGEAVSGQLAHRDEFTIALTDSSDRYRSWRTADVTIAVNNPLDAHVEQLGKYTDDDMHNVLAYLQTLR